MYKDDVGILEFESLKLEEKAGDDIDSLGINRHIVRKNDGKKGVSDHLQKALACWFHYLSQKVIGSRKIMTIRVYGGFLKSWYPKMDGL